MMIGMNTETCAPADSAALRKIFVPRPEAGPPLGWGAVRAFEAEHGVVLPEPYRTFVAEICDGLRAGPPFYGLLPLAQTPSDWGSGRPERLLSEPFPLTEAWPWEAEESEAELSEEEYQQCEDRRGPVFDHGSLLLGTDGCGMYWHLIVTGPERGHVWLIDENGAIPFGTRPGTSLMPGTPGFAGWVAHWAQGRSWFGEEDG
ncbi:SMI1/KNR4 family protein [Streptomyces bacillaris]|uniref:SMI1/KNR4 family protein n=2 Tax=Streptomyces TaxID=1883 RepID=A0ABY5F3E1_9ACTN|nr:MULTISPECIES: SMI1/KNR4 family protein [Streptomyces]NUW20989.1 SMI1/KNR4 family protein [Streptomyces roseoviolaceus]NUV45049.1 SMI1/KNR4 family protein [Streptomyces sp. CAI-24]NUV86816.1 SMI1/KNR4 family protein [Streptomyces sp. KAI-26]UTR78204.1 SMI1/KNR4 family protein [Streptomyces cavourensis]WAE68481.1 SMI1/KNR4 family protein [Streptomyces cavourensis]